MSTSTLTVATASISVYRAMFTLSGDNVQYQTFLSTFNGKTKIKKYDFNTFSDMTKQTILIFLLSVSADTIYELVYTLPNIILACLHEELLLQPLVPTL